MADLDALTRGNLANPPTPTLAWQQPSITDLGWFILIRTLPGWPVGVG